MRNYSLSHLADSTLLNELRALVARDRATTAELLAHIAEVDARRLYAPAAYPSMYAYCVQELGLCEQAAFKRIRAARVARQFPEVFPALAAGQLHLSGVTLLAPWLTPDNADELLAAAAHKSSAEIEQLLAERFPRPDLATRLEALSSNSEPGVDQLSSGGVPPVTPELGTGELSSGRVGSDVLARNAGQLSAGQVGPSPQARVTPLAAERYALQCTIGRDTHDKLRYAQELLGHVIPSGDVTEVLDRALDALIARLEKRKFATTSRPRAHAGARLRHSGANQRDIPAAVRRAVWERDGGSCTFVSDAGNRCAARKRLEYDHVTEVARGGEATVTGLRLRCRAHNQYAAECAFGAEFMARKREEARQASEARRRAAAQARHAADARARAGAEARQLEDKRKQAAAEVIPWLRQLGFRADEAQRAAALAEAIPDAPLEERVRRALSCFAKPRGPGRP